MAVEQNDNEKTQIGQACSDENPKDEKQEEKQEVLNADQVDIVNTLSALNNRVTRLEKRVELHVDWNHLFTNYIQPHQHLWMGVAVGLVFRFL